MFSGLEGDTAAIGMPGQHGCEILVAEATPHSFHDDLMYQGGRRKRDIEESTGFETQLEVLTKQIHREGRRVIQIDEGGCLVAGEGGSHHAVVEELEEVGTGDPRCLGQDGDLGHRLRHHTEHEVVADLHQAGLVTVADVGDLASEQLEVREHGLVAPSSDRRPPR